MKKDAAILAVVAATSVALLAASGSGAAAPDAAAKGGARLQAFGSCSDLLAYAKQHALPLVGPWGFGGLGGPPAMAGPAAGGRRGGRRPRESDYSTTNVQEEGVDEPDLVKSNGSTLFVVRADRLFAVDVRARKPRLAGSLQLPRVEATSCFSTATGCSSSRAAAHTRSTPVCRDRRRSGPTCPQSTLIEVDVSDPGAMRIVRSLELDAEYLSARLVGSVARVVTVSGMTQALPFTAPDERDRGGERRRRWPGTARSCGRRGSAAWLPTYRVKGRRGETLARRTLVQCRDVRRPAVYSGLGLLTVLTIDLRKGLAPVDSDSIVADGRTVYASQKSLYVATQRWFAQPVTAATADPPEGHDGDPQVRHLRPRLDAVPGQRQRVRLPDEPVVALRARGRAARREHRGADLVEPRPAGAERELRHDARRAGRRARPARPRRRPRQGRARLRRPLHRRHGLRRHLPAGRPALHARPLDAVPARRSRRAEDPRLLRLPAPARRRPAARDRPGRLRRGSRARARSSRSSTSPTCAVRCASTRYALGSSWSEAESDHHAFLWWEPSRLAVLPVQAYNEKPFVGAVGFRVGRSGIDEAGRVTHDGEASPGGGKRIAGIPIRRSLVVGDALYTVSDLGVKATRPRVLRGAGLGGVPAEPGLRHSVRLTSATARGFRAVRSPRPGRASPRSPSTRFRVRAVEIRIRSLTSKPGTSLDWTSRVKNPAAGGGSGWLSPKCRRSSQ